MVLFAKRRSMRRMLMGRVDCGRKDLGGEMLEAQVPRDWSALTPISDLLRKAWERHWRDEEGSRV
jgi:hypothetical protein